MSPNERLIGSYRLISMEHFTEEGEVGRPFGPDPRGLIFYTAEGYMSAILMRSDRASFAGGDILDGADAEKVAAFESASAFAGRYEVVGDQILHRLEVATYPNWVGTEQMRRFELTETHLTLYPPKMLMDGQMRTARVHWERL